jgi:outer membrane protein assembly factor BamB
VGKRGRTPERSGVWRRSPPYSIFTQQPQAGSGEAITLQTADQNHPLWTYQPAGFIASARGIVYVTYLSDVSGVGAGDNWGNITPTLSRGSVSVLNAVDGRSGRRLWRFQAPELPNTDARPLLVNDTVYFALHSHVCALHAQNGAVRWCAAVIDPNLGAEHIVDGEMAFEHGVLFVGAYHTLIAVDAASGKRM